MENTNHQKICNPTDIVETARLVEDIYTLNYFNKPEVVFCDSPYQLWLFISLYKNDNLGFKPKSIDDLNEESLSLRHTDNKK